MSNPRREVARWSIEAFCELLESSSVVSELHRPGDVRRLGPVDSRVETGVTMFGTDWPGVFIRGDDAARLLMSLRALCEERDQPAAADTEEPTP